MGNPRCKRCDAVHDTAAKEHIAELEARVKELEKLVYVPGVRKCAKCDFVLVSNTLHAQTGQISANDKADDCPNGCGPLWRVTERDAGNDMVDRCEEQITWRIAVEAKRDRLAAVNVGLRKALKVVLSGMENVERHARSVRALEEMECNRSILQQALTGDGSAVLAVIELLRFWFSPWGAAKGEMWENMSGDRAFTADNMLELMRAKLDSENGKEALDDG